jgi:hypothetical protein
VLDTWRRFTVDHPVRALSVGWLVIVLVLPMVAHWVFGWDHWLSLAVNMAIFGCASVFTHWYLTKDKKA